MPAHISGPLASALAAADARRRERAERFVCGAGWAPSLVMAGGRVMSGVEFVTSTPEPRP